MPAGNEPPPTRETVMTGQTTLNVKFCVASVPIPFAAVMIQAYGEPEAVPAPGVPAMVAVLLPLSVNVTPLGSVPVRVIPLIGKPVVLTVKVWPLTPWVKVALLALVMAGAWLMVSVKFCVAFGVTPLLPVMTIGERPPSVGPGVPLIGAVPLPLSVKEMLAGRTPVFDSATLTGKPVVVTAKVPSCPVVKLATLALVIAGA